MTIKLPRNLRKLPRMRFTTREPYSVWEEADNPDKVFGVHSSSVLLSEWKVWKRILRNRFL